MILVENSELVVRLKNWRSQVDHNGKLRMYGEVYDYAKFPDGTHVETDPIVEWSRQKGVAQTLRFTYLLIGSEQPRDEERAALR